MAHLVFTCLRQQRVASQTPREGFCQTPQIKTPDHFRELLPRLGRPEVISVRHGAAFEETHIAGQQNPAFVARDLRQALVGATVLIQSVKSQYPQVCGQAAEVHIEYEPWITERLRPQSGQSGDVERLEDRVNTDPVAGLNPVGEIHRLSVDQDEIDLRVGHAERLNAVLDRRGIQETIRELREAALRQQEIVEFCVEAEVCNRHDISQDPTGHTGQYRVYTQR